MWVVVLLLLFSRSAPAVFLLAWCLYRRGKAYNFGGMTAQLSGVVGACGSVRTQRREKLYGNLPTAVVELQRITNEAGIRWTAVTERLPLNCQA